MGEERGRQGNRWIGAAEVSVVALLVAAVVAVPTVLDRSSDGAFASSEEVIGTEAERAPLTEVVWTDAVDAPFGTVDLPGPAYDATVELGVVRTYEVTTEPVEAIAAGGNGQGVAVAELIYPPGSTPSDEALGQRSVAIQLLIELGVDPLQLDLVRDQGTGRALPETERGIPVFDNDYELITESTVDDTAISLAVVTQGERSVLVASAWPHDEPDPVVARVIDSVVIA